MSLSQSLTNGKVAQHAATSTPVLSNADSGATGNYIRLADINVLRDVRVSTPAEQIAVAVADGNLLKSTHYSFLDVPGHGPMIAHVFPQLRGSLLSISKLVPCLFLFNFLDPNPLASAAVVLHQGWQFYFYFTRPLAAPGWLAKRNIVR